MNKKNAILMFSGTVFGMIGAAYTPVEKVRPSKDFVEATYLSPVQMIGKKVMVKDLTKSEQRRQMLREIRETRNLVAKEQQQMNLVATHNRVSNLIETTIKTIEFQSKIRINTLVYNRAIEVSMPKRIIDPVRVGKSKGIVVVEKFEI